MNKLFFSDIHIRENELEECSLVLDEIISLCNQYNIDEVYNLGDTFDTCFPHPQCLDLFANFVLKLARPINIIVADSHESITSYDSVLNHFSILQKNVKTSKEIVDDNYMYLGHFIVKEAKKNKGGTKSKSELTQFRYVLLGHGHSYEPIGNNIIQLGSCRYIDFSESQDKMKMIAILQNYKTPQENWLFLPLERIFPMKDIIIDFSEKMEKQTLSVGKLKQILSAMPEKTKIRLIYKDFNSYSLCINELEEFKHKFIVFKEKKDFTISSESTEIHIDTNFKESLKKFLENKKIDPEIQQILLNETK